MKLYNFFRSSASYRVRIAMALKGLSYDNASINLAKGEQHQASYGAVNPQEIVPTLEDNGKLICLLYTSPSPRDLSTSRMPSSA